jgi:hypothetical protein
VSTDVSLLHLLKTFDVTLQNVSVGRIYGKAICSSDDLFHLYWRKTADKLYFTVFYAGSEKEVTN